MIRPIRPPNHWKEYYKRLSLLKQSSPILQVIIFQIKLDAVAGVLITALIVAAMCVDHELIVRSLLLSIYILCFHVSLDIIKHVNRINDEHSSDFESLRPTINNLDAALLYYTSVDICLAWVVQPLIVTAFVMGSFVDFALYIVHEVENDPDKVCNKGCIVSIYGCIVTFILIVWSCRYTYYTYELYARLAHSQLNV